MTVVAEPTRSAASRPFFRAAPSVRSGAIYAGSLTLQRAVGALLLPICVGALGTAAYGEVALMLAINGAAVAVMGFGLEAAIMRRHIGLASTPAEQRMFVSAAGAFMLTAPYVLAGAAAIVLLVWQPVSPMLLALTLGGAALQASATIVPFSVLRSEDRPMDYARINLQYTGVLAVLLLATVVWLDAGPAGWILANIVAWVSVLPYGLAVIKRYWAPSVRLSHLYPALAVGLPLVPHALAHWGLALSDRLVLAGIVSDEQLGVYSVGYQAAAFSGMLLTGLNWTVMSRYAQHQRASDLSTLLPTVVKQATFTIAICTCWVLLMPAVVSVVMPAAFESSADVVPLVALGYGFLGLYFIPANVLTMTLGKTYWLWACTVLAAIANVGFNLLAVPSMGIEGAAAGTALAYAVLFMLTTALALRTLKSRRQPQVFTNVA